MGNIIVKKKDDQIGVPDSTKYKALKLYSAGSTIEQISKQLGIPLVTLQGFLDRLITDLAVIKEARALAYAPSRVSMKTPLSMMNELWLDKVDQNFEQYAYYYATTGNNIFALEESKLHEDLPASTTERAKKFIYGARGRHLRSIPTVHRQINQYRDQRVKDTDVTTTLIQSELLQQLDELKEQTADNPRARGHILKTIELLGKTEGAFSETLNVNDTSTKTGMDILMAKVKEREGKVEYEQEE